MSLTTEASQDLVVLDVLAEQVRKGDQLCGGQLVTKIVLLEMSVCISSAAKGEKCKDFQLYRATPMRVLRSR